MKRTLILAVIACLAALPAARAQERARKHDSFYAAHASAISASAQVQARPIADQRPVFTPTDSSAARRIIVEAPRAPRVFPARPVAWRARYGIGYAYSPVAIGQYAQPAPANAPPAAAPAPAAPPMYDPATTSGAPAEPLAPAPGYKYGYAGRYPGAYAYSSAYNSGYYTAGCYGVNACCRASRRYCTPFGGAFRGCGRGCYIAQVPPCPTNCMMGPIVNSYAPPAYGTPTPVPPNAPAAPATSAPPTPAPEAATPPQPVEKKVSPAPQASTPRLPGFPPDA